VFGSRVSDFTGNIFDLFPFKRHPSDHDSKLERNGSDTYSDIFDGQIVDEQCISQGLIPLLCKAYARAPCCFVVREHYNLLTMQSVNTSAGESEQDERHL
jgi:hypothetical protein